MHENFIALDREKRDRIINAAMREFTAKGFRNASTNEIVKKAEISKGALFHYFSTKKDLLEFLYRYSIDFFMEKAEPHISEMSTDVFERWSAFAVLKIEIATQYPEMADFMQSAYRSDAREGGSLLKNELERFSAMFQRTIYEGIDLSKFKPDVDAAKALSIIWWVTEGFALAKQKEPFDISTITNTEYVNSLVCEMEDYLNVIKKAIYKDEFLK